MDQQGMKLPDFDVNDLCLRDWLYWQSVHCVDQGNTLSMNNAEAFRSEKVVKWRDAWIIG